MTATLRHHPKIFKECGFPRTMAAEIPPWTPPHLCVTVVCAQSVLLQKHLAREVISQTSK